MRKASKTLCILLCLALMGSFASALAQEAEDVTILSNLEEFLTFAENCRLDSYSQGKTFRLTADIDLTGTDFDGIPIFCGTFEGTHHTISGLSIRSGGSAKGLFRYVESGAVICDLQVAGSVQPTGSREQVGGIAGCNAGTIENCSFTGSVAASAYAGGIAGVNKESGLITGCTAEGTVSAHHFSGGIAGSNAGSIRSCTNQAGVNVTSQDNSIDISDITLGTLTSASSATATTDIGGIAGASSGLILGCTNRGNVGYPHMGYNVGGIAGLQTGYIADCSNYGAVSGRKEVGGIVGQQEPAVLVRYDTDAIELLQGQFSVLSGLIDQAASNANANTTYIRNQIYKIETYVAEAETAQEYLKSGLTDPQWDNLRSYADALQTIRDSIGGIDTSVRNIRDGLGDTVSDLDKDLKAITKQLTVIEGTLNSAEDHVGGQVFDSSDADTVQDMTSKVAGCTNAGQVLADLNAGGIVGAIVFENDLDPEEDISVVGDISLNAIGTLRSVILSCSNSGSVTAKTKRIGGIVGWMSMGLVRDCTQTGLLENAGADYVGGIAGQAEGYIRGCKVKSAISGSCFVGGIAGSGTIVSDCFAMVALAGAEQAGGILGAAEAPYASEETPIQGNYYLQLQEDVGGIDGISYSGMAQGLSQQEFLAMQAQCPIFSQANITFLADGQVVQAVAIPAGTALSDIPDVPIRQGYEGRWEKIAELELDCVLFDLTIEAVYTAHITTVQSDWTDANSRPVLLLQGEFSGAGEAVLTQLEHLSALQEGQSLVEAWQFSAPDCVSLDTGRLLLRSDVDTDQLVLLVRDVNGTWSQRVSNVDGSYLVFSLAKGDDAVALVQQPQKNLLETDVLIAGGVGALLVLAIVGICAAVRKKSAKALPAETEEE